MKPSLKKGCLIAFTVSVLVFILILVFVTWQISTHYGLTRAPKLSLTDEIPDHASCQVILHLYKAQPLIERVLPWERIKEKTSIPYIEGIVPRVIPYSIALYATHDFAQQNLTFSILMNEQRLGPILYEVLQTERPWQRVNQIRWDPEGVKFTQRGLLTLKGEIPIPDGVEEKVVEDGYSVKKGSFRLQESAGNWIDAYCSFEQGEILIGFATICNAMNIPWKNELEGNQFAKMGFEVAKKLKKLFIHINPATGSDELLINVKLAALPDAQGPLEFFISGLGLPMAQNYLKNQFGIVLDGNLQWDANESALSGVLTLKNYENFIKQKLLTALK